MVLENGVFYSASCLYVIHFGLTSIPLLKGYGVHTSLLHRPAPLLHRSALWLYRLALLLY